MDLPHRLERLLVIRAARETVFGFFTDPSRWAAWWGQGSSIDPRPGGRMLIRHGNGIEATGEVLEIAPPERIVFTYGYASGAASPPGSSRVSITLEPHAAGTRLRLVHEFPNASPRDEHAQGWRYQLSLFANLVADSVNQDVAALVDRWLSAWNDPDTAAREAALDALVSEDIVFADRFSAIHGAGDLRAHLAAVHRFMPGLRLERRGDIRHCQWQVLADWVAIGRDGAERGRGTNAFTLDARGRLSAVTGFWA